MAVQLDPVTDLLGTDEAVIVRSFVTFLLTLLIVYLLVRFVIVRAALQAMEDRDVDASILTLSRFVGQIGAALLAFGLAFAVAGFGSFLTALSAISGAIVIAVGLAANDLIANLLAGLYIINERLFEIGDWIEWDGERGRVERIDLRVTRVRTFDNELVAVPNATLANTAITNPVAYGRLRISVEFLVGYGDVDEAIDLIVDEASDFPQILSQPRPSVRIAGIENGFVTLKARVWMAEPSRSDFNRLRTLYVTNPTLVDLSGTVDVDGVGGEGEWNTSGGR